MKAATVQPNNAPEDCCRSELGESPLAKLPCPQCNEVGQAVETVTLKHHVKAEQLRAVERGPFYFCRTPACDVVYFSGSGVVLRKGEVRTRVGLKETEEPVPLCYCLGFTEAMVREEIHATGGCTIPQRIAAEVKAGNCACEIRNPQGSCCLGNVTAAVKKALSFPGVVSQGTAGTRGTLSGVENRRQ